MPNQNDNNNILSLNLPERGFNFGHINIQGICGKDMTQENVYSIFENLCYNCNNVQCSCEKYIAKNETVDKQFQAHSIDEKNNQYARSKVEKNNLSSSVTLYPTVPTSSIPSTSPVPRSASEYKSSHLASSDSQTSSFPSSLHSNSSSFMPNQNDNNNILSLNLPERGFNFGHINIQGICGKDMTKFSELKLLLQIH